MNIRTSTNYAPRSMRSYNWAAWDDENDGTGCPVGLGMTEAQAIANLEFWVDMSQRECIANAALIAAAPDLLAALKDLVPGADDDAMDYIPCVKAGRAAIAKAEGNVS